MQHAKPSQAFFAFLRLFVGWSLLAAGGRGFAEESAALLILPIWSLMSLAGASSPSISADGSLATATPAAVAAAGFASE
jgi:hypothetical protein